MPQPQSLESPVIFQGTVRAEIDIHWRGDRRAGGGPNVLPERVARAYEIRDHGNSASLPGFRAVETSIIEAVTGTDAVELALSEALANLLTHVRDPLLGKPLTIELHVRGDEPGADARFRALANGIADGAGTTGDLWAAAAEVLLTPAAAEGPLPTLTFQHEMRLSGPAAHQLLPRFLGGLGLPGCRWTAEKAVVLQVCKSMPGKAMAAWLALPVLTTGGVEGFQRISATLQDCLRTWVPPLFLAPKSRFDRPVRAFEAMAYSISRPDRRAKSQADRTVLDPESIHRAIYRVETALREAIAGMHGRLLREGDDDAADRYADVDTKALIRRLHGLPRLFRSLFATETALLEIATAYARTARAHRENQTPVERRAILRDLGRLAEKAEKILRHSLPGSSLKPLSPLILVEATQGANRIVGLEAGVETYVRLQEEGLKYAWVARLGK